MTKQDRQKITILGVLLAILASVVVMVLRINDTPATTTAAVQVPETSKISVNPPAPSDASLRKDLLDKPDTHQEIGKRNIFEYRQAPPPPPPPGPPRGSRSARLFESNPDGSGSVPGNFPPPTTQPPLPPQIPLKYVGYLTVDAPGGGFVAVLSDDSRHYSVTNGEVLMGRYRVLTISDKIVDIEDLEYKRRQSLPIVK
jgi:hypothetical protein